jgi:hypothetical protein
LSTALYTNPSLESGFARVCPKQPFWMNAAILLTAVFMVGSTLLFKRDDLAPWVRFGLVLLTLAPMAAWVIGFRRWLRTIDELERLIQLQAMGVTLGSSILVVLGWGLMSQAGLVSAGSQESAWSLLWAWMFGAWSVSQAVIRRRYQ